MQTQTVSYPIDAKGFIYQCAWCCHVADERGEYVLPAAGLLEGWHVSHGCCESCLVKLQDQANARRTRCSAAA